MMEVVDGQYQKYVVSSGDYIREHFFGKYPELLELVKNYSDEKLHKMRRGGHDPEKVYAAYKAAVECKGKPTVILAKTIKGYGLGEGGEGRNMTHNQKKLNEEELREFRTRFGIPISDERVAEAPFYRPPEDSPEMKYLRERRKALGGSVPSRSTKPVTMEVPRLADYDKTMAKLVSKGPGKEMSTTMGFVRLLGDLLRDKKIGKYIVPIVPDESRTFGMEGLFRQVGIYSHVGQLYEPVDSDQLAFYKEAKDGQLLEEGITEAGSMSSFIAAGTAYSSHGVNMIPLFIYYSMFGFQRIGDLIWAAADARAKGFMLGGTAGRTTLNGEGLQHQDGHSLLNAIAFPTVRAYDPAYAYEMAVIIFDGLKRMYEDNETAIYYITLRKRKLRDARDARRAAKKASSAACTACRRVECRRRSSACNCSAAARSCARRCGRSRSWPRSINIASDVWSVTSYTAAPPRRPGMRAVEHAQSRRSRRACRTSSSMLAGVEGPVHRRLATTCGRWPSRSARGCPAACSRWAPTAWAAAKAAHALRRHFEVDAECITLAALYQLKKQGKCDGQCVAKAVKELASTQKNNRHCTRRRK